jgi:hypothetical protein
LTSGYAAGHDWVTLTVEGHDQALVWAAFENPAGVEDHLREFLNNWKKDAETSFKEIFQKARPAFQQLFEKRGVVRPRSRCALIRHYCKSADLIYEYVAPIYKRVVGKDLHKQELNLLFSKVPEWPIYLLGWVICVFERAIQAQGYGPGRKGKAGRKPGTLDLWCAIYLTRCDCFVTADLPQLRALRLINAFNPHHPRTRILSYDRLRKRLLL